jgi:hypothetical protein
VSKEGAAFGQNAHDKTPCDAAGEQAEFALVLAVCFFDEDGAGVLLACPGDLARAASFDKSQSLCELRGTFCLFNVSSWGLENIEKC